MTPGTSAAAPLAGAPAIVLVVDDDEDVLTIAEMLLTDAGYEVMLADNGKDALRIVTLTRPDLLLLDTEMPEMDGYAVCAKLQQNKDLSYLPVLLLGSPRAPAERQRAVALGAVDVLTKPFHKDTLLEKVATHVKTNSWWQELQKEESQAEAAPTPTTPASDWLQFKQTFAKQAGLNAEQQQRIAPLTPAELYALPDLPVPPQKVARLIADYLKLPYQGLLISDRVAMGVLPTPFCKTNLVVPLSDSKTERTFVVSDPFNWELVRMLQRVSGDAAPRLAVAEPAKILALFDEPVMDVARASAAGAPKGRSGLTWDAPEDKIRVAEEVNEQSAPIIRLVNQLIENAYAMGASDVHIEPGENDVVVRYRVDGILRVAHQFPQPRLIQPLVSRLKIMADLDIVERRLPQDGRIVFKRFSNRGADYDLRVATSPMNHGEKVVLRILDKRKAVMPLTELGFSERNMRAYRERIHTPYGMILHVGPTGSGKSMSLYSALNEIRRPDINVQTAEDPIEYTLPGINQLQVNREIGLTFSRALRSYLRQDPDILLVGEIRDRETADVAVEAALTGHLLLSTLHTNDAASTLVRLIEMGIEPFMVSSSIVVLVAQRLLRRLCTSCKRPYAPSAEERRLVGVDPATDVTLYEAVGCDVCNDLGFKGRIATHEVLVPNDRLRKAITTRGMTAEALKRQAVEQCGMTTLWWDTMEKVRTGVCALDDVLTEIRRDEFDARPDWMFEELGLERPADRETPPF